MSGLIDNFPKKHIKKGSVEEQLLQQINPQRMPVHVAVIMDGNGRWAGQRGLPRVAGHREGAKSVHALVEYCGYLDIKVLTVYAFSVENWKRPESEVNELMKMLSDFLRKEVSKLVKYGIRFQPIGRWRDLPESVVKDLEMAIEKTSEGKKYTFQVALNYGGRAEIVDACKRFAGDVATGKREYNTLTESELNGYMYYPDVVDPDLLIRTSGEFRISNFLIWEIAYSELYFTDTYWPDFRLKHLLEAIVDYQKRERRFGGLSGEQQ